MLVACVVFVGLGLCGVTEFGHGTRHRSVCFPVDNAGDNLFSL